MSPRLFVVLVLTAGLLVPGSALPARAADCFTWIDPKGDSAVGRAETAPVTGEADLDLLGVTLDSAGGAFTTVVKVADLNATGANKLPGDRFTVRYVVAGKLVQLTATRDVNQNLKTVGWTVDGTAKTPAPEVTYDATADTVTATLPLADWRAATGADAGSVLRALYAEARGVAGAPTVGTSSVLFDTATAPDWYFHVVGTPCAAPIPDPPVGQPTAGCDVVTDDKGDGKTGTPVVNVSGVESPENDPDLDLTGIVGETTADELKFYLRVDKLAAQPARGNGHFFELQFTTPGGKTIAMDAGELEQATGTVFTGRARFYVNGTDRSANLPGRARFDRAKSLVMFALDRASMAALAGETISTNAVLAGVYAESNALVGAHFARADEAPNTVNAEVGYRVGDNGCFAPPPARIASLLPVRTQYGDPANVTAKLTDAAGAPLPGKTLRFAVGSDAVTAATDATGVARGRLTTSRTAGAYTMTVSFAGDSSADPASATVAFTVVPEATRLTLATARLSGTSRKVTATLTDDDGKALRGQPVTWSVDGKRRGTKTTDAAGRVVLGTVRAGQRVSTEFAGVSGKYASSRATTKA